ncbi:hypothetical protein Msil_2090 [Methylocella silvestris BL2]|uniref:Uncharacterized protein n=1 Tax=Methylocella silvestris (strain DSM 15510 / CIP 108128 / LMG 27833 / NCIMB 13906 / BL2) TaxID=395965 RepID=B8ERH7_METSB|nr:hypothetical protein [Methylocella silvestris]ACK51029.1 hypothetical protein Msil_2090 [Methylocella silvestris BL2]
MDGRLRHLQQDVARAQAGSSLVAPRGLQTRVFDAGNRLSAGRDDLLAQAGG